MRYVMLLSHNHKQNNSENDRYALAQQFIIRNHRRNKQLNSNNTVIRLNPIVQLTKKKRRQRRRPTEFIDCFQYSDVASRLLYYIKVLLFAFDPQLFGRSHMC